MQATSINSRKHKEPRTLDSIMEGRSFPVRVIKVKPTEVQASFTFPVGAIVDVLRLHDKEGDRYLCKDVASGKEYSVAGDVDIWDIHVNVKTLSTASSDVASLADKRSSCVVSEEELKDVKKRAEASIKALKEAGVWSSIGAYKEQRIDDTKNVEKDKKVKMQRESDNASVTRSYRLKKKKS